MNNLILPPNGTPLELPELGLVLVAHNLQADVEPLPLLAQGQRGANPGLDTDILQAAEISELATLLLTDPFPDQGQNKQLTLFGPGDVEQEGQLLLYTDENGAVTFHLPQTTGGADGMRNVGELVRYDIPIRPLTTGDETAAERGVTGYAGKKMLQIIGWKVAGAVARKVGPPLVRRWEAAHRPRRAVAWPHLFEPTAPDLEGLIPAGRSLLFIHGTFSRVASAFQGLAEDTDFLAQLKARYGSRIYGFDHATLANGVATNVMQLYDHLAPGEHTFDIICHSRGGLVARALRDLSEAQLKQRFPVDAERGQYGENLNAWGAGWRIPDGVTVKVNRILFGATPNSGTILAQPTHLKKYLEVLMTATNLLPEFVDISVDALLIVAKLLVSEVMPVLPGLDDQQPQSSLLPLLAPTPRPQDAAIQADYTPPPGQARRLGADNE